MPHQTLCFYLFLIIPLSFRKIILSADPNASLTYLYHLWIWPAFNISIIYLTTPKQYYRLLSYNSPVNDTILQSYLSLLTYRSHYIKAVDTNFSWDFFSFGWEVAYQKYFLNPNSSNYAKKNKTKPTLNTPTIIIPIHINGAHWVALVHQNMNGHIHFLYADDMNSSTTASSIRTRFLTPYKSIFFSAGKCHLDHMPILHLYPTFKWMWA